MIFINLIKFSSKDTFVFVNTSTWSVGGRHVWTSQNSESTMWFWSTFQLKISDLVCSGPWAMLFRLGLIIVCWSANNYAEPWVWQSIILQSKYGMSQVYHFVSCGIQNWLKAFWSSIILWISMRFRIAISILFLMGARIFLGSVSLEKVRFDFFEFHLPLKNIFLCSCSIESVWWPWISFPNW